MLVAVASSPTHPPAYSLTHLPTHPPTCLLTHPPAYSLTHLPTHPPTCLLTHPPTYSPTRPPTLTYSGCERYPRACTTTIPCVDISTSLSTSFQRIFKQSSARGMMITMTSRGVVRTHCPRAPLSRSSRRQ